MRRAMQWGVFGLVMVAAGPTRAAEAQAAAEMQTFHLANVNQVPEANEIVTAMRNFLDPSDKVFYVPSQNAIMVGGTPEQLKLARRLLDDLDRPKKSYRLTFTTDESDAGKVIGTQHFSMIVVSGGRTDSKVGRKVPIVTGSYDAAKGITEKQVTYLDVGLNVNASLDESSEGLRLRTKVERMSVADEHSSIGGDDPIIRQAQLEGTANLVPGKTLVLGSLDVPGSTRHVTVSVVAELVR